MNFSPEERGTIERVNMGVGKGRLDSGIDRSGIRDSYEIESVVQKVGDSHVQPNFSRFTH